MSMNVGSGKGDMDVVVDMNTTPLIDVMLVLLIMLIITIPVQTHAIKLDMPAGNPPAPLTPPVVVTIDVDFDGTIFWDGQQIPDRATLNAKLQDTARLADQPEVHLKPNKLVKYAAVAAVMADAQRLGVKKLGLIGSEQFLE